eukprot:GABW01005071.1.p1 GENE.GABW01005071.1~~GABW01005071.1.p1  ORF type:complete len:85 (-),score=14.31 GABW01005071.1:91-345(-)
MYHSLYLYLSSPQAGEAVDVALDELSKVLQPGDVVMDGGNSNFHDSERRCMSMSGIDEYVSYITDEERVNLFTIVLLYFAIQPS